MKKFGLIGHPIAHSLSPALFKAGYDGKYPYDLIEGDDFEASYQRFIEDYDGINVTAPFKELAFAKADLLSEECRNIKATNLLIKTPEGIKAYNSDYLGVRKWLEEVRTETAGDLKVLIVGMGGAGKAAAEAARSLEMNLTLMNRTVYDESIRPLDEFCSQFRESDKVIYNIPAAIPQLEELAGSDFGEGRPKYTLEANYKNPAFNEVFVKRMTEANPLARHTGGRTWLLYQALTGYEIFTGEKPDLQKMSDVL